MRGEIEEPLSAGECASLDLCDQGRRKAMNGDDLIRRGDALAAIFEAINKVAHAQDFTPLQIQMAKRRYEKAIAAVPAVNDDRIEALTEELEFANAAAKVAADLIETLKAERNEAIRRRDAWKAKAEGYDEMAAAVRSKIKSEPATLSRVLLRGALAEIEARFAKAVGVLRLYSCEGDCRNCPAHERDRDGCGWTARAVLAEIEGGKTDG
jgi:hypothetical protein